MKNKVADFIAKHQLLSHDALHVVALSGGADSVALLLILKQLGYRIEAAHCNFHLRGEESLRDEDFVKSLCQTHDIPLHLIHFDTKEYATLHQVSIEMAARDLRYGYFHQLCQDIGASTICVAHHRDDAVETLLMNLIRGAGIHGLTGIRPKNGQIVRPLLCLSRQEIEDYLHRIHQDYVVDSTNLVDDVVRNKIRLRVLPLLCEINPNVAENIDKTAHYLQQAEKIFNNTLSLQINSLIEREEGSESQKVAIPSLQQLPSPEAFLHEWLTPFGFNSCQTEQIFAHLNGESGREFSTASHTLLIDRNQLILEPLQTPMKAMKIPETGHYRYTDNIRFLFEISNAISISNSVFCATLDIADIQFPLTIRPVQTGDKFCPLGMKGHRLISDFLTDQKLSLLEKRRQLVVTDAHGEILWLVGLRIDHRYRVTNTTSSILRITVAKTL
ncbi:MAG: tRNA lysidine(34) synthetase TilS [Prevotella sp.]|nr:tRNA lysidine(34) synthetase TilS [Prevotella sp.]